MFKGAKVIVFSESEKVTIQPLNFACCITDQNVVRRLAANRFHGDWMKNKFYLSMMCVCISKWRRISFNIQTPMSSLQLMVSKLWDIGKSQKTEDWFLWICKCLKWMGPML